MTEEEWLATADINNLIWYPKYKSDRKLRLFNCAAVRHVLHFFPDDRLIQIIASLEQIADDKMEWNKIKLIRARYARLRKNIEMHMCRNGEQSEILVAIEYLTRRASCEVERAIVPCQHAVGHSMQPDFIKGMNSEKLEQLHLARDIFGNPFRLVVLDPRWQTSTAVGLAQTMYESREFGAMPILADALQDAGCEDDAILSHCRDAKQHHVRGCWVVDLVLGKS
jgi:hypothetical protein